MIGMPTDPLQGTVEKNTKDLVKEWTYDTPSLKLRSVRCEARA
jgi:hypothetical protein